jgi:hypothetical protein
VKAQSATRLIFSPSIFSQRQVAWLLFLLIFVAASYGVLIGIDFGTHWDEHFQYDALVKSAESGVLLPHRYNYPSVLYWLSLASVYDRVFEMLLTLRNHFSECCWYRPGVGLPIYSEPLPKLEVFSFKFFLMRARTLVAIVCALGGLWLFLSLIKSRIVSNRSSAAVAAGCYLASWEFGYHARWLAPDMIMGQFVALFLLFLVKAEDSKNPQAWLNAAGLAVGLAAGTKYLTAALLIALWVYTLMRFGREWRVSLVAAFQQATIASITFLLTTPGLLIEPVQFILDFRDVVRHYSVGHVIDHGARPWDIHGFWTYLGRLWEYLALALFSPCAMISAVFTALAAIGLAALWNRSIRLFAAISFILIFYSLAFSRQVVFIVRNFLFLLPVLCILCAIGFDATLRWISSFSWGRLRAPAEATVTAGVLLALAWNTYQQILLGLSIEYAKTTPLIQQLEKYLTLHPQTPVALSSRLWKELRDTKIPVPSNIVDYNQASLYLFKYSEIDDQNIKLLDWPATKRNTFDWIGPREVNLNYYSRWLGPDRIVILDPQRAHDFGVAPALFQ